MTTDGTLNGTLFEGSIKGGTPQLFPTKELLTDKARYPRGFTPDRLREVQQTTRLNPQADHPSRAASSAGVRDTLAASTAPVEDMKGVHWYTNVPQEDGDTAAGTYHGADRAKFGKGTRAITITKGWERSSTPVHELGHHVSEMSGTPHSSYDTTTRMGAEEAYAENYADVHFRDRRGSATAAPRIQASAWTHDGHRGGRYGGFHEGFDAKRLESPVVQASRARDAELAASGLRPKPPGTKNHVPGQERFLDRTESGSRAMGATPEQKPKPAWNYVYRGADDPNYNEAHNLLHDRRHALLRANSSA